MTEITKKEALMVMARNRIRVFEFVLTVDGKRNKVGFGRRSRDEMSVIVEESQACYIRRGACGLVIRNGYMEYNVQTRYGVSQSLLQDAG